MPLIVSDLCMLRYQCARQKLGPDTIQGTNSFFFFIFFSFNSNSCSVLINYIYLHDLEAHARYKISWLLEKSAAV